MTQRVNSGLMSGRRWGSAGLVFVMCPPLLALVGPLSVWFNVFNRFRFLTMTKTTAQLSESLDKTNRSDVKVKRAHTVFNSVQLYCYHAKSQQNHTNYKSPWCVTARTLTHNFLTEKKQGVRIHLCFFSLFFFPVCSLWGSAGWSWCHVYID